MSFWQRMRSMFAGSGNAINDERMWSEDTGPIIMNPTVHVTPENVQQIPEVYNCLKILSETVGALPLVLYRKEKDGTRVRADNHPIAELLQNQPNDHQDAYEFRAQMTWDLALHRNAFAEILPGKRGLVDQLVRIDPLQVQILKNNKGGYVYEYSTDQGIKKRVMPMRMFHLRATPLSSDNLMGRSLLKDGWRTFARALLLEDYSRRFFENDARPSGILKTSDVFQTKEQNEEYRRKWQLHFSGQNRHKVAVLDTNSEYQELSVPNDKAQFIETSRDVSLQILRFFRMQPHKVGILDRATFSNIEEQSLSFVIDTLLPLLVGWEKAIKRQLILSPGFYAEYNVAGLLRGDLKTRYEAYAMARNWGWMSVNDIRKLENMDPIEGGNTYLQPLNMTPVGAGIPTSDAIADLTPKLIRALEHRRSLT